LFHFPGPLDFQVLATDVTIVLGVGFDLLGNFRLDFRQFRQA